MRAIKNRAGDTVFKVIAEDGERPPEMPEFYCQAALNLVTPEGIPVGKHVEFVPMPGVSTLQEAFQMSKPIAEAALPAIKKKLHDQQVEAALRMPAGALPGERQIPNGGIRLAR